MHACVFVTFGLYYFEHPSYNIRLSATVLTLRPISGYRVAHRLLLSDYSIHTLVGGT